jgi:seryl-tRNA synthetase
MLDVKFIRDHPDLVREAVRKKGEDPGVVDSVLHLDEARRKILVELEQLRAEQKRLGRAIAAQASQQEKSECRKAGRAQTEGQGASVLDSPRAQAEVMSSRIGHLEKELREREGDLIGELLHVPNIPHPDVVEGAGEEDNVERPGSRWGEPRRFDFDPKPHWEIGEHLGILDFERGVKVSGSRMYLTMGLGCRLVRALINFMIDVHVNEHGYQEVYPPVLVLRESMTGTGQLPKFEEDAYRTDPDDLFLIPTAEVPVTNMHRDEILEPGTLPLNYVAYTACFRREAGSAGRDTRGVIRVHQFDKVEMVKFVEPERSYEEYGKLTDNACAIMRKLGLAHRIMDMCTGDLGFTAAKKCDPEAWFPARNGYLEVSSCSNFEDFQARRAQIRYRREKGAKPQFVHTLNGSGLAVGRTLAAILENYQEKDGSVRIPEVLVPYMSGTERLTLPA